MAARPTEIASRATDATTSAGRSIRGGAGIFDRLADDHAEITTLMQRVAATGMNSRVRAEVFPTIRVALVAHWKVEETEVYPVFRTIPELVASLDESVAHHAQDQRMLDELVHMSMGDPHWIGVFRALLANVHRHVEKEQVIFSKAKDALTREQSEALEERFLRAKQLELDALTARS